MKIKLNYVVIPLVTILTALLGSFLTSGGMGWYSTIKLPAFTPPGYVIGMVWTAIFIISTIAALIFWNRATHNNKKVMVGIFLLTNAILNIAWSFLFFDLHLIKFAIFESGLLLLSVIELIIVILPTSRTAALLLVPYAGWVSFATYLTYVVWTLNR